MAEEQHIIANLLTILNKVKTLKEEEFTFSTFVKESKNGCGTICCVAGWFPKWFPNSPFRWSKDGPLTYSYLCVKGVFTTHGIIFKTLSDIIGTSRLETEYLFGGVTDHLLNFLLKTRLPIIPHAVTLKGLIAAWENFIEIKKIHCSIPQVSEPSIYFQ